MKTLGLIAAISVCVLTSSANTNHFVYFGTYTSGKSKGIYVSRFDPRSGKLSEPELATETKNPNFLAVHPMRTSLYAVGEMTDTQGKRSGAVNAYSLDVKTGKLAALNQQSSGGSGPCHVSVDATGKSLLVANYGSGSVASLPIRTDGNLSEPASTIQHIGSSVNPKRQTAPHAHFITPSPDNRFALACDLGLDKVLIYRLDATSATLTPHQPAFGTSQPGFGPRHLAFSAGGKFIYVINELSLNVSVFAYDTNSGAMNEIQSTSSLPAGYTITEKDSAAHILAHPNGRFVYASNRGHDSIAVFSVEAKTGKLTLIQNESTQGKTPRNFAIDPSGRWLLALNQNSDSVVVFAIDDETGKLKPTGQTINVGSPVCAVFVKTR